MEIVQPYGMFFSERCLRRAINFEMRRGHRISLGIKVRSGNFLGSSFFISRSKHKVPETILYDLDAHERASIADTSKLFDKVSARVGYNNLHDSLDNGASQKESDIMKEAAIKFNLSLACKKFPSIILGRTRSVVLYDETLSSSDIETIKAAEPHNKRFPGSMGTKWLYPDGFGESWPSLYPAYPNMTSSFVEVDNATADTSSPEYTTINGIEVTPTSAIGDRSSRALGEISEAVEESSVDTLLEPSKTVKRTSVDGLMELSATFMESNVNDVGNQLSSVVKDSYAVNNEASINAWNKPSTVIMESVVGQLTILPSEASVNVTSEESSALVEKPFSVIDEGNVESRKKSPKDMKESIGGKMTGPLAVVEESSVAPNHSVLDTFVEDISGLSKKQREHLENCGFHTLKKLLHHFPRTYANLQSAQIGIDDGQYVISIGKILSSRGVRASSSLSIFEVIVSCEIVDCGSTSEDASCGSQRKRSIYLHLKKFFRGFRYTSYGFLRCLEEKHKEGDIVCVSGKVRPMRPKDHYEMREYDMDILEGEHDLSLRPEGRPYPIYSAKGGLSSNQMRDIIWRSLQELPIKIDPIPIDIIKNFGLVSLYDAYIGIHRPREMQEADSARKRMIFDEFFYIQLARLYQMLEGLGTQTEREGLLDKYRKPELSAVFLEEWSTLTKKFLTALPYSLTPSQLTAVSEIIWDLKRPVPMYRLLQGDVGCGKTVVAFLACVEVISAGYQAAFMVPTELLALQHYEQFLELLERMDINEARPSVVLLTGSTPSKQARMIRQGLQDGEISMVIGTHSLISESVKYLSLRMAVVDEQHRFGVVQRGRFNSKLYYTSISTKLAAANCGGSDDGDTCMAPHILAMSATPIPRTLALALYGDMSLTQITDLPPGRVPVDTHIIKGDDDSGLEEVHQMMQNELQDGGKIYVVYPVIEQSELLPQLHAAAAEIETVSQKFPNYSCGLLHGRMKSDEKDEALRKFRSGETRILLATQVIEIGVDVPDASMMVVMNAERFGIAQLHQLRGRVGRGEKKSKCILVSSSENSLKRLEVLGKSSDGFYLANMDLLLRGPGDLLGKKQSGHLPEFPVARLEVDGNILQDAHHAALKILGMSHNLEKFPELKGELSMRQPLCILGD